MPITFLTEPELHRKGLAEQGAVIQIGRDPVAEPGEAAGPRSLSAGSSQKTGAQGKEEHKNSLSRTSQGSVEGSFSVNIIFIPVKVLDY